MESKEEQLFTSIGGDLKGTDIGKMFGKSCLKVNGKAYAAFFKNDMVFKLADKAHEKAIALKGAKLWDPSGKKRPMKEWVQLPYTHKSKWKHFAEKAMQYVVEQTK